MSAPAAVSSNLYQCHVCNKPIKDGQPAVWARAEYSRHASCDPKIDSSTQTLQQPPTDKVNLSKLSIKHYTDPTQLPKNLTDLETAMKEMDQPHRKTLLSLMKEYGSDAELLDAANAKTKSARLTELYEKYFKGASQEDPIKTLLMGAALIMNPKARIGNTNVIIKTAHLEEFSTNPRVNALQNFLVAHAETHFEQDDV